MLNKVVISVFCFLLLIGCSESDEVRSDIADRVENKPLEQQLENTSIYLRSGVGVDFGRKPLSDKQSVQETGKYRHVTFSFDESPETIDAAIGRVLEAERYKRELVPQKKYKLQVVYRKSGAEKIDLVNTVYSEVIGLGGEVKTKLLLSILIE